MITETELLLIVPLMACSCKLVRLIRKNRKRGLQQSQRNFGSLRLERPLLCRSNDTVPNLWIQAACPLGEKLTLKNAQYFILKGRFCCLTRKQIAEKYVF